MTTETIIANTKQMIDDLRLYVPILDWAMQVANIRLLQRFFCINF